MCHLRAGPVDLLYDEAWHSMVRPRGHGVFETCLILRWCLDCLDCHRSGGYSGRRRRGHFCLVLGLGGMIDDTSSLIYVLSPEFYVKQKKDTEHCTQSHTDNELPQALSCTYHYWIRDDPSKGFSEKMCIGQLADSWLSKCKKEPTHPLNQHFRESMWFALIFDEWTGRWRIGVWNARLGRQHEISMSHI